MPRRWIWLLGFEREIARRQIVQGDLPLSTTFNDYGWAETQ